MRKINYTVEMKEQDLEDIIRKVPNYIEPWLKYVNHQKSRFIGLTVSFIHFNV